MYARDIARIATPIGMVVVTGDDTAIGAISIEPAGQLERYGTAAAVRLAALQLQAWFAGEREDFCLPLAPAASPRGEALRAHMAAIAYGATLSYGALARLSASSARAIGQACARNPFPIVVPCHRVLNADGTLGAYSAGDGAATKAWLLAFERRHDERLL